MGGMLGGGVLGDNADRTAGVGSESISVGGGSAADVSTIALGKGSIAFSDGGIAAGVELGSGATLLEGAFAGTTCLALGPGSAAITLSGVAAGRGALTTSTGGTSVGGGSMASDGSLDASEVLTIVNAGTSGYTTGSAVATTASAGTGLTVDIVASGGIITSVIVNAVGSLYKPETVVTITGGSGDATVRLQGRNFEVNTAVNATALGSNAIAAEDNAVMVGEGTNSTANSCKLAGTAIIDTKTPSSASDTGTTGMIAWDASYVYICTATDTWKRSAIATW